MPQVKPRRKTGASSPESLGTTLAASTTDFSSDPPYWQTLAQAVLGQFQPTEPDPEPPPEPCGTCQGAGWISRPVASRDDPDFGKIAPCPVCTESGMAQRDLTRRIRSAGVSEKQAGYDFDSYLNFHPRPDYAACHFARHYAEHGARSILLIGPTGTGKTSLGLSIFRHRIADGKAPTFLYLRTVDLFNRLYATMHKDSELSQSQVTDAVSECALLMLDDLGKEKASEYVASKFYEIIGLRCDWERPTIFTSNLSLEELEQRLGDATYWRVMEMCEGNVYLMDGANLRDPRTRAGGA